MKAQVILEVREWGNREETDAFIKKLKKMASENDSVQIEAEVILKNS